MISNQNNIKKIKKELLKNLKKFPTKIMNLKESEKLLKIIQIKDNDII
jgi:hypothetical protein